MWDGYAGVTTGPVTVPLVLAMGLGLGNAVSAIEGFGILSLASICPIIAVLTMGIIIQLKNKFSQKKDDVTSIDPNLVAQKGFKMSERNITYLTNACTTCIVEMGSAEKVLEAAKNSGAQGATINYARGTGIREK